MMYTVINCYCMYCMSFDLRIGQISYELSGALMNGAAMPTHSTVKKEIQDPIRSSVDAARFKMQSTKCVLCPLQFC